MTSLHSKHEVVFISGSRVLSKLNPIVRARLENIMNGKLAVMVGDAAGADRAVQDFFAECEYKRVTVYCMDGKCRHNVYGWNVESISPEGKRKDRNYFAIKDRAMSEVADYGLMIWDGVSTGTLNNVINMLKRGKKSWVYISNDKKFQSIKSIGDLKEMVNNHARKEIARFDKKINYSKRTKELDNPASREHYQQAIPEGRVAQVHAADPAIHKSKLSGA